MQPRHPPELAESHSHEGMAFDVRVFHVHGFFWGEWTCAHCGKSGGSTLLDGDITEALGAAKVNFSGHCFTAHRAAEKRNAET